MKDSPKKKRYRYGGYGLLKQLEAAKDTPWLDKLIMTNAGIPNLSAAHVFLGCSAFFRKDRLQELRQRRLGDERIERAFSQWAELYGRKHKRRPLSVGVAQVIEMARKHPNVDPKVAAWYETELQVQKERDPLFQQIGSSFYAAYVRKDLDFFRCIPTTIRAGKRPREEQLLFWIQWLTGGGTLTLKELTEELDSFLHRPADQPLDESYVRKVCKRLGVRLKPGIPGYPKGRPRNS